MSLPPIVNPDKGLTRESALEAATGVVRGFCGWHVAPEHTETLTLDGHGRKVLQLPSMHVTAVHSVNIEGEPVEVAWSANGLLRMRSGRKWPEDYRNIEVELTHGFQDLPEVIGIIQGIAARTMINPTGALTNQRAGTQGISFASFEGATGSTPLLETEKAALAPYRLVWGP